MRPTPPGFNKADVTAGLVTAMQFGAPNSPEDRATFVWVTQPAAAGQDEDGVPFSPDVRPSKTVNRKTVPCAVDYAEAAGKTARFGTHKPSRITVTLLAPHYAQVKDFEFVVWGGDKYVRRSQIVEALGSLDVYSITCVAEDES